VTQQASEASREGRAKCELNDWVQVLTLNFRAFGGVKGLRQGQVLCSVFSCFETAGGSKAGEVMAQGLSSWMLVHEIRGQPWPSEQRRHHEERLICWRRREGRGSRATVTQHPPAKDVRRRNARRAAEALAEIRKGYPHNHPIRIG
jgi:hypothetical protein